MNRSELEASGYAWQRRRAATVFVAISSLLASCAAPSDRESDCPLLDIEVVAALSSDGNHSKKTDVTEIENFADQLVGLPEILAVRCAEEVGLTVRIMVRDEEAFLGTGDFIISRLNLEVNQGKVEGYGLG